MSSRVYLITSFFLTIIWYGCKENSGATPVSLEVQVEDTKIQTKKTLTSIVDSAEYIKRIRALAHDSITSRWPAATSIYPQYGAILPYNRIVAYYGNFYSRHMGILGEITEDQLIINLKKEVKNWSNTDTTTPVIPAIHYIAITVQSKPGQGNKYRLRMPDKQINKAIELGRKINGITFLDIQVGHSNVQSELPSLKNFLKEDGVHLGLDPEWAMKDGTLPGKKIGTMDAGDINFAIKYLSDLVKAHQLKPKILVVHRFTIGMITNSLEIKPTPQVQVVINMDGFGFPAKKVDSYKRAVSAFPVQFTGFKLFYKNDKLTPPHRLMTNEEILRLYPKPVYIQYQ